MKTGGIETGAFHPVKEKATFIERRVPHAFSKTRGLTPRKEAVSLAGRLGFALALGALGVAGDAADGPARGLVGRLGHCDLEDAHEDVGTEGAGALEGLPDFGPVTLGAAGFVERLPNLLEKEV